MSEWLEAWSRRKAAKYTLPLHRGNRGHATGLHGTFEGPEDSKTSRVDAVPEAEPRAHAHAVIVQPGIWQRIWIKFYITIALALSRVQRVPGCHGPRLWLVPSSRSAVIRSDTAADTTDAAAAAGDLLLEGLRRPSTPCRRSRASASSARKTSRYGCACIKTA